MITKTRKGLLLLFTIALTVFALFFSVACDKEGGKSSGGTSSEVETYNWNGLQDFNLKITDASYSYEEVTVTDDEGLIYSLTVDDSGVAYGTQGEYTVKFIVEDQVKEQKVKIYGLPTINVEQKIDFTYEEVMDKSSVTGLFAQVTATDGFGNAIAVGVEESAQAQSLYNQDGSVDYGEYAVTLGAVDAAGQVVTQQVEFTVLRNEQDEPTIDGGDFSVDVVEQTKELNVSLKNREIVAVSINGTVLNSETATINEYGTLLTIDLSKISELEIGSGNSIKIITSGGYTENDVTLTDEEEAVMDVSGRDNQIAIVGETLAIVQPKKVYEKQNFTIELSMISPSGVDIDANQSTFNAEEMGVYVLTATAKRNGVECGTATVKYNVHEEFNSFKTEENRTGFKAYKSIYWTDRCTQTGTIGYEAKTLAGVSGNFLYVDFADASYLGFSIPTAKTIDEIEALKDLGVESVFVNVYNEGNYKKKVNALLHEKGSLDDGTTSADEAYGLPVDLEPKTWTKISVDIEYIIDHYQALKDGDMFFFNVYNGGDGLDTHENFKIYFSSMLFDLPPAELEIAEDEYNSFGNTRYLKGAKVYRDINTDDMKSDGVTLSWANEEVGGVLGNFAKVNIDIYYSGANGVAPARVGVNFPIMKTLEEIIALKDSGYTHLAVPMYIDCTEAKKIMGTIFTIGESETSVGWLTLPAKTWTTFEIPIDDIVANYADLADGTKVLLPIVNSGDGGEINQARFNVYYGAMKFVVSETDEPEKMNTTYNAVSSTSDVKVGNYDWNGGLTANDYQINMYDQTGGKYPGVFLVNDGNGFPARHASFSVAPQLELSEIQALKDAGYNKLQIGLILWKVDLTNVKVNVGVFSYTDDKYQESAKSVTLTSDVDDYTTVQYIDLSIDDIIANYEGLRDGSKYLFQFVNNQDYGSSQGNLVVTLCSMEFIKVLDTTYNNAIDETTLKASRYSMQSADKADGLYFATETTTLGETTGSFLRVHLAYDSNGIGAQYVGISIMPEITLEQLQTLKNAGYGNLSVNYYLKHKGGAQTTFKYVIPGVNTYAQDVVGTKVTAQMEQWNNFTISIDDIIENYAGLKDGSKYLMHIVNSRDEGDNAHNATDGYGHFYIYFGDMEFVPNTTYNAVSSTSDVKVGNYDYNSGLTANDYQINMYDETGGKYPGVFLVNDGNGFPARHASFSVAPQLELSEIQALKDAGYNKLQIGLILWHVDLTNVKVNVGVFSYTDDKYQESAKSVTLTSDADNYTTVQYIDLSIDDIIANYEGLRDGSKYLFQFVNNQDYGSSQGNLIVTVCNMEFVR